MTEDNVLLARVERAIKAFPPAIRNKFLARVLTPKPEDGGTLRQVAPRELAKRILYPEPIVAPAPAATTVRAPKQPVKRESIKDKLLRTGGTRLPALSQAVNAESPHNAERLIELVLERADTVILQAAENGETLVHLTPGAASGKHWIPGPGRGTSGSAAYHRYKDKYVKLGYKTMVPLYVDERACANEELWLSRKDFCRRVENALHRHFGKHVLYRGSEGGKEPSYSNTTHFYVYLAIKCTE